MQAYEVEDKGSGKRGAPLESRGGLEDSLVGEWGYGDNATRDTADAVGCQDASIAAAALRRCRLGLHHPQESLADIALSSLKQPLAPHIPYPAAPGASSRRDQIRTLGLSTRLAEPCFHARRKTKPTNHPQLALRNSATTQGGGMIAITSTRIQSSFF